MSFRPPLPRPKPHAAPAPLGAPKAGPALTGKVSRPRPAAPPPGQRPAPVKKHC